jgi:hypothetical protein
MSAVVENRYLDGRGAVRLRLVGNSSLTGLSKEDCDADPLAEAIILSAYHDGVHAVMFDPSEALTPAGGFLSAIGIPNEAFLGKSSAGFIQNDLLRLRMVHGACAVTNFSAQTRWRNVRSIDHARATRRVQPIFEAIKAACACKTRGQVIDVIA